MYVYKKKHKHGEGTVQGDECRLRNVSKFIYSYAIKGYRES